MEPYLYTENNPIMFTDSTGMSKVKDFKIALQKIENDDMHAAVFQKEMEDYATIVTKELLQMKLNREELPFNLPEV